MTLATYASRPEESRGRQHADFTNIIRSPFQRDRDRLIHSSAFRKLDGKTQVFAYHEGKNYRTRLTHSIEVSQITRTICKNLNLNEDLGEAIALAHDLGHSPFGHAGERTLNIAMEKFGGFDHNVQSLRIITKLERHYPEFDGLNLTWETIEGTVKHNGPLKKIESSYLKSFNKKFDLDLKNNPSLEAQTASLADDVAYNNHDIDDGFRAGFFTIEKLRELPFINDIMKKFEKENQGSDECVKIYAITRNMISRMVFDILDNSKRNIKANKIKTIEDVRKSKGFIVDFSDTLKKEIKMLRAFLKDNFYTNTSVVMMDMKSQKIVEELFAVYMSDWKLLPMNLRAMFSAKTKETEAAEIVCEYIAGMTDMMALEEHKKLFNPSYRF